MRADLSGGLLGVPVRPTAFGIGRGAIGVANHTDGAGESGGGGGVLTKVKIPDPLGLRAKYVQNPEVIECLDNIWAAVQEFNEKDGKDPLDLASLDLSALSRVEDDKNRRLNLERYIIGLGVKSQDPLIGARLDRAILTRANLNGANLDGASLNGARLDRASLIGANLDGARLNGANLDRASLNRASLHGAILNGAILDGVSLDGARLYIASLDEASLVGAYVYEDDTKLTGQALKQYLKRKFPSIIDIDSPRFE